MKKRSQFYYFCGSRYRDYLESTHANHAAAAVCQNAHGLRSINLDLEIL